MPQYNPQVVYTESSSSSDAVAAGLIGFTAGIAIGAAIDNDYYYGPYGWGGGAYMYNDAWDDWYDEREDMRETGRIIEKTWLTSAATGRAISRNSAPNGSRPSSKSAPSASRPARRIPRRRLSASSAGPTHRRQGKPGALTRPAKKRAPARPAKKGAPARPVERGAAERRVRKRAATAARVVRRRASGAAPAGMPSRVIRAADRSGPPASADSAVAAARGAAARGDGDGGNRAARD